MRRADDPLDIPRLLARYAPEARAALLISPEGADDPAEVARAADSLSTGELTALLASAWAAALPGERLPRRLLARIERDAGPLWDHALLLPDGQSPGLQPRRYAGACRLNPHLRAWVPPALRPAALLPPAGLIPAPPAADARWDARIVAERLERDPLPLSREGALWKDGERRLLSMLSAPAEEAGRWSLALAVARIGGLLESTAGKLAGRPDARWRGLPDPAALFPSPAAQEACRLLLRCVNAPDAAHASAPPWLSAPGLLDALSAIPDGLDALDPADPPDLAQILRTLHRVGLIEAARVSPLGPDDLPAAIRRPAGESTAQDRGAWITPDLEIMLPVDAITAAEHARLCRLAPFTAGDRVQRYRLSRAGVDADLRAGHREAVRFLAAIARHPLPPTVRETIQEWERQHSRIRLWTGVSIVEEVGPDGTIRLRRLNPGEVSPGVSALDYADPASTVGQVTAFDGLLCVPGGQLPARAAAAGISDATPDPLRYRPRPTAGAAPRLARLARYLAAPLPGALEARVRSGDGHRAEIVPALLLRLDPDLLAALQRDPDLGPLLRRSVAPGEVIIDAADQPALAGLLAAQGIAIY